MYTESKGEFSLGTLTFVALFICRIVIVHSTLFVFEKLCPTHVVVASAAFVFLPPSFKACVCELFDLNKVEHC